MNNHSSQNPFNLPDIDRGRMSELAAYIASITANVIKNMERNPDLYSAEALRKYGIQ